MQGSARKDVVFWAARAYTVTVPGPKWKSWIELARAQATDQAIAMPSVALPAAPIARILFGIPFVQRIQARAMSSTPPGGARPGVLAAFLLLVAACGEPPRGPATNLQLIEVSRATMEASPLLVASQGREFVLAAASDGMLAAIDPRSTSIAWRVQLPASSVRKPYLEATPVQVGDKLVVSYTTYSRSVADRQHHWVAVVDLERRRLHRDYPVFELSAKKQLAGGQAEVRFHPGTQITKAALAHGRTPGGRDYVYVSFGSPGDVQPWHGWVFEIDLAAWKIKGPQAAISAVLLTTPEAECPGETGTFEMICGGGVWSPAGPQVLATEESFELLIPTGNGQLDLVRNDYANTLLRVRPGLDFDPACDEMLCRGFDPIRPARACVESCVNLFIPRIPPGAEPLRPDSGRCNDKTLLECWALHDYDLGANAPLKLDLPSGRSVLVQPGKDGSVFLIDAQHLGKLYDRRQIVEPCGAPGDDCSAERWRGQIITQPVVAKVEGSPVVLVPTFNFDHTHPAGLVALKIVTRAGSPRLEVFWTAPDFSSPEAVKRFRYYPSRVVLAASPERNELYAWVVDVARDLEGRGVLLGVRVRDGTIVSRREMAGRGHRNVRPLVHHGVIYIPSSWLDRDGKRKHGLEAFSIRF